MMKKIVLKNVVALVFTVLLTLSLTSCGGGGGGSGTGSGSDSDQYVITASAGTNGSILPLGAVIVDSGSSQDFTITTDANYHVADVLVDAVSVGAVTNYTFANVTGDHTIESSFASDHIFVTVGDSITGGLDDDDPSDDTSQDGRNSGGGYQPILNDLLTDFENGVPHNILKEGVGGIITAEALSSIQTTLAKYLTATRYLIIYGTSDARPFGPSPSPVPSGKGLNPGDSGYAGSYKDNMQQIIDAINGAGKEVVLAKIPIALGDYVDSEPPYVDPDSGARNVWIKEYNEVIDELVIDPQNNITITPPDFYNYFKDNDPATGNPRYVDQYSDNLHPNGLGYQSMADLWFDSLSQGPPPPPAPADQIIIDNGNPETSFTGTWVTSTEGDNDWYSSNYLFSTDSTATYTFETVFSGSTKQIEVYQMWSFDSSPCSNIQIEISDLIGVLDTVFIDQSANFGQWNSLGTYNFTDYARVKIYVPDDSCSVNADAVRFAFST